MLWTNQVRCCANESCVLFHSLEGYIVQLSGIYGNVNKPRPRAVTLALGWFTAINPWQLYYNYYTLGRQRQINYTTRALICARANVATVSHFHHVEQTESLFIPHPLLPHRNTCYYALIKVPHVPINTHKNIHHTIASRIITLWGEPEQDIGSHCKHTTCTTQNECMGLRVKSYQSTHSWCYTYCTLIQHITCSAGQMAVYMDIWKCSHYSRQWLGGPSIATKIQVTTAFLPFALLSVVEGPAVPTDKMSIQTCGLRTRCPQDEMFPPHLRLRRVGIATRSPLQLGSYQFIASQFFWEPAPHYSAQVDW